MKFMTILSLLVLFCSSADAKEKAVGITWMGKSGMTKRVIKGFEERMKEASPKTKLIYNKELKDESELHKTVIRYQSKGMDGMLVLRSTGAKYLAKNPPSIPSFVGGCNNPKHLKVVHNLRAPEGNVTGVSYFLELDTPFEIFKAIHPKMKNLLVLLEKDHPSALVDQEETQKQCTKSSYTCTFKMIKSSNDIKKTVKKHLKHIDTIILGNQAKVFDNIKAVMSVSQDVPVLSYSDKPVEEGALVGFVADDHKLGRMLADSVIDVVVKGKKVSQVPVKFDAKPKFKINEATITKLKLDVPYVILKEAQIVGKGMSH